MPERPPQPKVPGRENVVDLAAYRDSLTAKAAVKGENEKLLSLFDSFADDLGALDKARDGVEFMSGVQRLSSRVSNLNTTATGEIPANESATVTSALESAMSSAVALRQSEERNAPHEERAEHIRAARDALLIAIRTLFVAIVHLGDKPKP